MICNCDLIGTKDDHVVQLPAEVHQTRKGVELLIFLVGSGRGSPSRACEPCMIVTDGLKTNSFQTISSVQDEL